MKIPLLQDRTKYCSKQNATSEELQCTRLSCSRTLHTLHCSRVADWRTCKYTTGRLHLIRKPLEQKGSDIRAVSGIQESINLHTVAISILVGWTPYSAASTLQSSPSRSQDHSTRHNTSTLRIKLERSENWDFKKDESGKRLPENIIKPAQAEWATLAVFVQKKNGTLLFFVKHSKLNAVFKRDSYPIPCRDEWTDMLGKAFGFLTLDASSSHPRIEFEDDEKKKTAFTLHHGLQRFVCIPFGFQNGPDTLHPAH